MITRWQIFTNDLQVVFALLVVGLIVFSFLTGVAYWVSEIWELIDA